VLEKVIYVFTKKIEGGGREITTPAKIAFHKLPLVAMVPYSSCQ